MQIQTRKSNSTWHTKRRSGIVLRKANTDSIKDFIEYAKSSGSQSAEKYYISFTKMQTSALFPGKTKEKNIRDKLDIHELSIIEVSDKIISNLIQEGIRSRLPYKDIFKNVKVKINEFAKSIGV